MKAILLPGMVLGALGALAGTSASAQSSAWGYFEPEGQPIQAGVVSDAGGQLILKCDERGKGKVFAAITSPQRLRPASDRPQVRSIWFTYDGGPREEERWRYNADNVVALNTSRDRTLVQFLRDVAEAEELVVRLEPTDGAPFDMSFRVAGARDAIARVFESCGDENFVG